MPSLHVTWTTAGILAAVLLGVGTLVVVRLRRHQLGQALREAGVVIGLFALWMFVGHLVGHHPAGAYQRGDAVWRIEQWLHIDSEAALQAPLLAHHALLTIANYYYAYAHWQSVDIVLIWLWLRHRDDYRWARNALVLFTGSCLLLHLISVAPPRLLPQTGVVDTGSMLGQSVYHDSPGLSDSLSAMPSIHVGWAVIFAIAAWRTRSHTGRALTSLHLGLTAYVVVVTGNHFWLDGIVAAAIVAVWAPVATRTAVGRMQVPDPVVVTDSTPAGIGQRRPAVKESAT